VPASAELPGEVKGFFPYPSIRPFQDEFMKIIHEAVRRGCHVVLEGSNGLGKTAAVLSACLPIIQEQGLQILYTAKTHRQHDRVIEELNVIAKRRRVSGLSVRGRQETCFHPIILESALDARSAMEVCEQLKAGGKCPYYANIQENYERFGEVQVHVTSKPFRAPEVQEICRAEGFCPYELNKQILGEVDVAALSYLYVFDPVIRGAFLKHLEKPLSQVLLVVDEAHNLPNAAVDMASDSLSLFALRRAEQEADEYDYTEIATFFRKFRALVEKMAAQIKEEIHVPPEHLIERIVTKAEIDEPLSFFEHLHNLGNSIKRSLLTEGKPPRSFIHRAGEFLLKWVETAVDASYTHVLSKYVTERGTASARLEVVALDPSKITGPVFLAVHSSVNVSGTLEPLESYIKITNLPEETVRRALPSPFPEENILSLVCCGVTTTMERRTREMYRKLAKRVAEISRYTPANVGVFTASYEVLEGLLQAELENVIDKPLFPERRGMSSKENDLLISRFKSYAKRGGAVLLGVEGGRSSEGADYPGPLMNAVAVVGVPYAEPTPRVAAQVKYYENHFPGHGREYGYILPALKKASQAAGRPVRTLEDRAAIVFLDYRFATSYCQHFLPRWVRRGLKTLPDRDGLIAQELLLFFGYQEQD